MIRIGTRQSELALAQTRAVMVQLALGDPETFADAELVSIRDLERHQPYDKSQWVANLESALITGEIDLAVHSAKDVPASLPRELALVAVPERGDPRDVICGADSLEQLPAGSRVGTSSLRRKAQLLAVRSDLEVIPLRGNVETRLEHLARGEFQTIILAYAGLQRLGRAQEASAVLDPTQFVPAAGQGTLALEGRIDSQLVEAATAAIGDPISKAALAIERSVVNILDADCHAPIGIYARKESEQWEIHAFVGLPDGQAHLRDQVRMDADEEPEEIGRKIAERLSSAGATELIAAASNQEG